MDGDSVIINKIVAPIDDDDGFFEHRELDFKDKQLKKPNL